MRLWVEILKIIIPRLCISRQPPCEAVSWNEDITSKSLFENVSLLVRLWVEMKSGGCVGATAWPSASLWGCELKSNTSAAHIRLWLSASLWGCELKYVYSPDARLIDTVSLLVRLWVEIWTWSKKPNSTASASLWGCELKFFHKTINLLNYSQPPCEAVSWNDNRSIVNLLLIVSLLVRLWVEIYTYTIDTYRTLVSLLVRLWVEMQVWEVVTMLWKMSASLWGCELKYIRC